MSNISLHRKQASKTYIVYRTDNKNSERHAFMVKHNTSRNVAELHRVGVEVVGVVDNRKSAPGSIVYTNVLEFTCDCKAYKFKSGLCCHVREVIRCMMPNVSIWQRKSEANAQHRKRYTILFADRYYWLTDRAGAVRNTRI